MMAPEVAGAGAFSPTWQLGQSLQGASRACNMRLCRCTASGCAQLCKSHEPHMSAHSAIQQPYMVKGTTLLFDT